MLAAGDYTVAVTQFDNFAIGPNLSDGFDQDGNGNFTAGNTECTQSNFCDVTGTPIFTNRTNLWRTISSTSPQPTRTSLNRLRSDCSALPLRASA